MVEWQTFDHVGFFSAQGAVGECLVMSHDVLYPLNFEPAPSAGAVDYLNLLETQRSLYVAQDNQVSITQGQLASFIQLRKALGT